MPEAIRPNFRYFTEARMQKPCGAGYAQPFTSIEDGVGRYVESHRATSDRYPLNRPRRTPCTSAT
jgi:ADP-L-glycero-D-manno-heptose 6-epimerase